MVAELEATQPKTEAVKKAVKQVPLVVSHFPCLDGFSASWACWLKHPDWEFVSGVHGAPPPDVRGRQVYMLDFSYKRDVMMRLAAEAESITVLDHHKTAEAELQELLADGVIGGIFDMNHSGAYLAWVYFHGITDGGVPYFVRLVEDRDLWRFAMPSSRELNACFFSYPYDFVTWNGFLWKCEDPESRLDLAAEGAAIERKHHKDIAEIVAKVKERGTIAGHSVWVANLPYTLASDACHLMAQNEPFAASYFREPNGITVSLRSTETGIDVSEIAKRFGGGGHKHAAGFTLKGMNLTDFVRFGLEAA